MKVLVDAGTDINKGKCGYIPLMNAASWVALYMVEFLLKNGANPYLKIIRDKRP